MAMRLFLGLALLVTLLSLGCGRANVQSNSRYTKRLVHDTKTGQYIGVLTGECKVYERKLDKEVITYRVERSDGTTIDLPSDKVTVTEQ
jgi:hypothetical protein